MMFRGAGLERFRAKAPEIETMIRAVAQKLSAKIEAFEKLIVT
jgi:hypothetical protein